MDEWLDRIRSALFVDFDNIFIGLQKIDAEAAERFATNPGQWLGWIEQGMVKEVDSDEPGDERSVLVRRCYMNPKRFHPYRPYFTRAAFHVIDTPTLTTHGKTAADIHMVMDILDTLRHETRFDEFIILSGDADFTPVLLRLRAHDRRTAAAILGPAAEAYRSAADVVIDEDTFIEAALGISSDLRPLRPAVGVKASDEVLDDMAGVLLERVQLDGEVPALELPGMYKQFSEFTPESNWLGFWSLRRLTQAVVDRSPELRLAEGGGSWLVRHVALDGSDEAEAGGVDRAPVAAPQYSGRLQTPIGFEDYPAELADTARRVHRLTGTPLLSPDEYAVLFETVSEDVTENGYHLTRTSKAARDRCIEEGTAIPRSSVAFVLKGLVYSGHRFEADPEADSALSLAAEFARSVEVRCQEMEMVLTDDDRRWIKEWIAGEMEHEGTG